ncbi:hypothetical protein P7K49_033108 [Saguinus oedipus]|uniref:Uncharacterized protein n=1 Tax=Saguinus oedipus TaxID=9490 RepID=A0ABQ9TRD8_SAGOE|nr:hypothetical protein P7K49_033108 [Saguinus oedipus]
MVELYLNEKKRGLLAGTCLPAVYAPPGRPATSGRLRAAWPMRTASSSQASLLLQVMFLHCKGQVIMTIELLDTEEAQTEDPVEVQVRPWL